ncbi:MAG: hypothetical protein IH914_05430 [candidate division Zixibacteria bacterium]|nr:hypothetical protein [candidate division Zixibacteria bacterium]
MKNRNPLTLRAGSVQQPYSSALLRAAEDKFIKRLFGADATVFGKTGEALKSIENRLGWLHIASDMKPRLAELDSFASSVIDGGIRHALVLGMGGSSLAPEMFSRMFGPRSGLESLRIMDTTDPAAIRSMLDTIDVSQTLFIIASKSGKTIETMSHARFFFDLVSKANVPNPGSRFVAITDEGSDLEKFALDRKFRRVFLNPADIGGRYSALSYFGLLPAAFSGANLTEIVDRAIDAEKACAVENNDDNSAFQLGALWAVAAERGIDKLTIIASDSLRPLVPWIEQLVAESTGKEGNGVIPIESEPLGAPGEYGTDRMFMFLSLAGELSAQFTDLESAIRESETPSVSITFKSLSDIGFELFRQEAATATAGYVMGINPFDEPNVSESKENTAKILANFEESGSFPHPKIITAWDGLEVTELGDAAHYDENELDSPARTLKRFATGLRKGSYVAILNYFGQTEETERALENLRRTIRNKFGIATLRGYGPRFLHSIGQLYKGGPAIGHFIVLTHSDQEQIKIPEAKYSFNQLIAAQSIGDTESLVKRNLPTLMINCATDPASDISTLASQIDKCFKNLHDSSMQAVEKRQKAFS